jgi:hypothetical protein
VADLECDISRLDHALRRADDLGAPPDLDGRGLSDVVLVALDGHEVAVGEYHDVVRECGHCGGRDTGEDQRGAGQSGSDERGDDGPAAPPRPLGGWAI